ncbi:unnamed protein product [Mesocestoides corti]|uniref:Extensin-like n=1 Tax=Mesocestoides corti TaxID=53468 RepID=A0A0R3UQR3_MESCO|nr:unnamed protein product [Mesocestoides corti]
MAQPSYDFSFRPFTSVTQSTANSPTNLNISMPFEAYGRPVEFVTHSISVPNTPAFCAKRPRTGRTPQVSLTSPVTVTSTPSKVVPSQVTPVIHGTAPQPTRNLRAQWSQLQHNEMTCQMPSTGTQPMSTLQPPSGHYSTMGSPEMPPSLHSLAPQKLTHVPTLSLLLIKLLESETTPPIPMGSTQSTSTLSPASGQSSTMWPQEMPPSLRATASQTLSYWQPRSEIIRTEMAAQTPMGGTQSTSTLLPASGQTSSMIPPETVPSFHDTAHQTLTCSRSPSEQLSPPILSPHFDDTSPQSSTSFHSATSRSPTSAQSPLKCTSSTSSFPPAPARYSIPLLAEMT